MAFRSSIHVLAAAFLMGLAAATPIGPVNMMAIRRGVAGGWRHTLACAFGSVFGDLVLFSLALAGGSYFLPRLSDPKVHTIVETVGVAVLLPVGTSFLALAVRDPRRAYRRAHRLWGNGQLSSLLIGEAAESAALTVFNPLSMLYWAAVTSSWLPFAFPVLGAHAAGWGVLMSGMGLATWFTALILFVRFVPHRANASLFRVANATLALVLLGFGAYCAVDLSRLLAADR
jgi:L-lysine exporter family protein LysE/ArgO